MENIHLLPEWLGSAMIGAVIAALGYVLKLLITLWSEAAQRYRENRARLVNLYSMLNATQVAFKYQLEVRKKLYKMIHTRDPYITKVNKGFEQCFSKAYANMTDDELELHKILQAYTIHTIQPLNTMILDWLQSDSYFKTLKWRARNGLSLDDVLADLEGHLYLWQAKYQIWIPNQPHHALVYLADENKHGLGFPKGSEECIKEYMSKKHWLFG